MTPEEKKELYEKLDKLKEDISGLKATLNSINEKKEAAFEKKNKISTEIRESIKKIKDSKSQRNDLTKQVAESKDKRKEFNDEIKKNVEKIKELSQKKQDISSKYNIKGDPSYLKAEIDKLDLIIETEAPSFKKEQKIMKDIKEKKKQYKEAKKVSGVFDELHKLKKETDKLREKADEAHKKIQTKANSSQEHHEHMLTATTEINDLRKTEKEAMNVCNEHKEEFSKINVELKQKLDDMNELKDKLGEVKEERKKEAKKKETKDLKAAVEEVEQKIKKRQKLTTEDLIAMQGMNK